MKEIKHLDHLRRNSKLILNKNYLDYLNAFINVSSLLYKTKKHLLRDAFTYVQVVFDIFQTDFSKWDTRLKQQVS